MAHEPARREPNVTETIAKAPASRYAIGVLGKAFDLIDLLDVHETLTLTELSVRAGINKVTVLRIMANLEERRYVERDANGRYHLGVRLLQLGMRTFAGLDLRTVARPALKRLHAEVDETVNLGVPGSDGIIYIDILESAHGLRMAASVGKRDDYHSTAMGKAIMAQWPPALLETTLAARPLVAKTPSTVVDPGALRRMLARVRAEGFAIDDEENEASARCVGAPLFDHRGVCVGAISVSGPAARVTAARAASLAGRVVTAAREISSRLGHTPSGSPRTDDMMEGTT